MTGPTRSQRVAVFGLTRSPASGFLLFMRRLVVSSLAVFALCCAPAPKGAITAKGYESGDHSLAVVANEDGKVLPKSWRLDNMTANGTPKKTADYMTVYEFDLDDDGTVDEKTKELVYQLRYENLQDDGKIWLRTFPISTHDREKKLRVLMKDYVDEASRAGFEVVVFGMRSQLVERRYGTRTIREGDTLLAKRVAYDATVEVANIDRIKVDPKAVETRVRLVLVKFPYSYAVKSMESTQDHEYPMLLLAGYANNPEDFESGEKDFEDFLNRIKVASASGYRGLPSEESASTESEAPASEASTTD